MKARYLLALVAACTLVAPGAFAQVGNTDDGTIGPIGSGPGGGIISRLFTTATLRTPAGQSLGRVRTATIQTEARGLQQGLKLRLNGLTSGAEYALVIDNTLVGTATANSSGTLRMAFASPATGRAPALPEAITPIGNARVVQLFAGQTLIATGEFLGTRGGDGGGR
jgi:hypothetical protein